MDQLIRMSQRVCAKKRWVNDEDEGYGASEGEMGGFTNPMPDAGPDDDARYLSA